VNSGGLPLDDSLAAVLTQNPNLGVVLL